MNPLIIDYDGDRYNFRDWARNILQVKRLEEIHKYDTIVALNKSPTSNQLSNAFASITKIYRKFVTTIIAENFGEIASYQSPPSFRFHYKGYGSSVFHRDRDFGVDQGKVNVWIPLTEVYGTNSLWLEAKEGSEKYLPVSMSYGQALIFDGVNMVHGSKINKTFASRISFDFRFESGKGPAIPAAY